MLEELHTLEKYYSNLDKDFISSNIESKLITIRERAKVTAPEAMFLRWQELDQVVDFFLDNEEKIDRHRLIREYDLITAYLRKWE
jgi:hypothetical protein